MLWMMASIVVALMTVAGSAAVLVSFIGNRSEEGNGSETEREISEISAGEREAGGERFSEISAGSVRPSGERATARPSDHKGSNCGWPRSV